MQLINQLPSGHVVSRNQIIITLKYKVGPDRQRDKRREVISPVPRRPRRSRIIEATHVWILRRHIHGQAHVLRIHVRRPMLGREKYWAECGKVGKRHDAHRSVRPRRRAPVMYEAVVIGSDIDCREFLLGIAVQIASQMCDLVMRLENSRGARTLRP